MIDITRLRLTPMAREVLARMAAGAYITVSEWAREAYLIDPKVNEEYRLKLGIDLDDKQRQEYKYWQKYANTIYSKRYYPYCIKLTWTVLQKLLKCELLEEVPSTHMHSSQYVLKCGLFVPEAYVGKCEGEIYTRPDGTRLRRNYRRTIQGDGVTP